MSPGARTGEAPSRTYGGVSAPERTAQRREQLLEAGLDLLGTEGWQATTVRGVCDRAGLTARYFYESFEDLNALVIAVFERVAAEATETVIEALGGASPDDDREVARAAIGAFVELMTEDPRKGRVAFIEAMGNEKLLARRFEVLDSFAAMVAERATQDAKGPDAAERAALTSHVLVGGLTEALVAWLDGRLGVSRERLVEHCADLFVAAARAGSPGQ